MFYVQKCKAMHSIFNYKIKTHKSVFHIVDP